MARYQNDRHWGDAVLKKFVLSDGIGVNAEPFAGAETRAAGIAVNGQITVLTAFVPPLPILKNPLEPSDRLKVPVMAVPPCSRKDEFCDTAIPPDPVVQVRLFAEEKRPRPRSMVLCNCTVPAPKMASGFCG